MLKQDFPFSPKRKKLFQSQQINLESAGTIIKDFESMLGFIEGGTVTATERLHLFSMKLLPELNARLAHPLQISLKRPQQKAYPNINGLYLLLRATGIVCVVQKGKKHFFTLDETLLKSWRSLTSTERYFSLLQAWWCRGRGEILGERDDGFLRFPLNCLEFFTKIPKKGVIVANDKRYEERLRYFPGLHYVALMELFEFITIKSAPPQKKGGWRIHKILPTAWGDALVGSFFDLTQTILDAYFLDASMRKKLELDFEEWSALARPYFPEWKRLLSPPEHKFQKGAHVFNVSLDKAWRRFAVPGESSFENLAQKILDAFDFDNDHLYRFIYKDRYGLESYVDHPYLEEPDNFLVDETRVGDLPLFPKMEMIFFFDFGDSWKFEMTVEEIDSRDISTQEIKVIERHGEAPDQYPDPDIDMEW